jgi:hypothetical protein
MHRSTEDRCRKFLPLALASDQTIDSVKVVISGDSSVASGSYMCGGIEDEGLKAMAAWRRAIEGSLGERAHSGLSRLDGNQAHPRDQRAGAYTAVTLRGGDPDPPISRSPLRCGSRPRRALSVATARL